MQMVFVFSHGRRDFRGVLGVLRTELPVLITSRACEYSLKIEAACAIEFFVVNSASAGQRRSHQ